MSRAIIVVDLGFGDAGKGTVIDALARCNDAKTVVRFNGGPQAGHNVVSEDGRHHTFAQFGSAMLLPGTRTLLSRFMLIEPYAMLREAEHLTSIGVGDALRRTWIDRRCVVITPVHIVANRLRELARGSAAHGTCGMGVGEAVGNDLADPTLTIRAADLASAPLLRRRLGEAMEAKRAEMAQLNLPEDARRDEAMGVFDDPTWIETGIATYARLADSVHLCDDTALLRDDPCLLFEGAQGVLLDQDAGFAPHTTWSRTTFANALDLLADAGFTGETIRVGVTRTYSTRHGPGPFIADDASLAAALPEPHNTGDGWQGQFRVGPIDRVMLDYALRVTGGVDCLAVTHLDRLPSLPAHRVEKYRLGKQVIDSFAGTPITEDLLRCQPILAPHPTQTSDAWLAEFSAVTGCPIGLTSAGPTASAKRILLPALSSQGL